MSRRDQIKMSDDEVKRFLGEQKTIILCSNGRDGYPHPVPMWFDMDAESAVLMATYEKSPKVANIRADPRVNLLAESGVVYEKLKGVQIWGRAEVSVDLERTIDVLLVAGGLEDTPPEKMAELRAAMTKTASKRVLIRVLPQRMSSWDHSKLGGVY